MSNCPCSANSQLKAIQARLDRIDDDLIAHYAGISELVASLSAYPPTAAAAVKSLRTYNFSPVGQRLLKSLLHMIPGYDTFKRLQHLDSAALIDNMGEKLGAYAAQMAETAAAEAANAAIDKAEAELARAVAIVDSAIPDLQQLQAALDLAKSLSDPEESEIAVALAESELSAAIASGMGGPAMQELQSTYAQALAAVQKVEAAINAILNFFQTLSDIADCRTRSSILQP